MAVLALYAVSKSDESLENYLDNKIFASAESVSVDPDLRDVEGFDKYMERYNSAIAVERLACEKLN